MDKEIVDKTIEDFNLKKETCGRLIQLCDLVQTSRENEGGISYSNLPIASLQALGLTYNEVKLLQAILHNINNYSPFSIANKSFFEPDSQGWLLHDDTQAKSDKFIVLKMNGFTHKDVKAQLEELLGAIPEEAGKIMLLLERNTLKRSIGESMLSCDFEEDGDPISLLHTLMRSKKPKRGSELGQGNWSRTVAEVNTRAKEKLQLNEKEPLIVNDKGYKINGDKYLIS